MHILRLFILEILMAKPFSFLLVVMALGTSLTPASARADTPLSRAVSAVMKALGDVRFPKQIDVPVPAKPSAVPEVISTSPLPPKTAAEVRRYSMENVDARAAYRTVTTAGRTTAQMEREQRKEYIAQVCVAALTFLGILLAVRMYRSSRAGPAVTTQSRSRRTHETASSSDIGPTRGLSADGPNGVSAHHNNSGTPS